ncbi:MAG: hypothetical protein KJO42_02580 [Silicimonas sp.]|nr:hypothetical protein [Silicimonas sp.]
MSQSHTQPGGQGTRSSDTKAAASAAEDLAKDAKDKAGEVGENIRDEARYRAEAAKEGVADELSGISSALRKASSDLRDGSPQERTFGAAANALADVADTVRGKDLGEMVDDLSDFARRNPVAFLGGAALLGFAGVRMAKASRRARIEDDRYDNLSAESGAKSRDSYATASVPRTSPAAPATITPQTQKTGGV